MSATNIILAEDDEDDTELFKLFYSGRADVELMTVVINGIELIEYLESIPSIAQLPDLIVLDQNMPKMNGQQTLQYLKSSKRFSHIPAVIYSTYANSALVLECSRLGASMVAVKPIDKAGYQQMMDDFLQLLDREPKE